MGMVDAARPSIWRFSALCLLLPLLESSFCRPPKEGMALGESTMAATFFWKKGRSLFWWKEWRGIVASPGAMPSLGSVQRLGHVSITVWWAAPSPLAVELRSTDHRTGYLYQSPSLSLSLFWLSLYSTPSFMKDIEPDLTNNIKHNIAKIFLLFFLGAKPITTTFLSSLVPQGKNVSLSLRDGFQLAESGGI
jgi:hypothetical protein